MTAAEALGDIENIFRDFISLLLKNKHGANWEQQTKLSADRITKWGEKREEERKKQPSAVIEERLIYYSDFYDVGNIIEKNWDSVFQPVFDDLQKFKTFFKILSEFRNPVAHQRELLKHQQDLIVGIVGEFRTNMIAYRSQILTGSGVFPQIELVIDNFGNRWAPGDGSVQTQTILYPGELLKFTIHAVDPNGGKLFYGLHPVTDWQEEPIISIQLDNSHVGNPKAFTPCIKSDKDYHAEGYLDQTVMFSYYIYPKK